MDISTLKATGLSAQQASAYALLLEKGQVSPGAAARQLGLSRTNAYKIFDKLVEYNLAEKNDDSKKLSYRVTHPTNLSNFVYGYRSEAQARESALNSVMQQLMTSYKKHADKPSVETVSGKDNVITLFRRQIMLGEDISFIHTKSDIPAMGYDTMHTLRVGPSQAGLKRDVIISEPYKNDAVINYATHKKYQLNTTWIEKGQYTSPVEWSITKSSVLIAIYEHDISAIYITDELVAESLQQLFNIFKHLLEQQPTHQRLQK